MKARDFYNTDTDRIILAVKSALLLNLNWLIIRLHGFSGLKRIVGSRLAERKRLKYTCEDICWAVEGAAWRLPWCNTCLIRAATEYLLMRRSGHAGVLKLGVKNVTGEFLAHAWVEDEQGGVLFEDREDLKEYSLLAFLNGENDQVKDQKGLETIFPGKMLSGKFIGDAKAAAAFGREVSAAFPKRTLLLLFAAVLSLLFQAIGLVLLLPFLSAAGIGGKSDGMVSRFAASILESLGINPELSAMLAVYLGLIVLYALLRQAEQVLQAGIEADFILSLRKRLFSTVVHARWQYIAGCRRSDFVHAAASALIETGSAVNSFFFLAASALTASIYLGFAFILSPVITLVVLCCGLFLLKVLYPRVSHSRGIGERYIKEVDRFYGCAGDSFSQLKEIKVHGRENWAKTRFNEAANTLAVLMKASRNNFAAVYTFFSLGSALLLAAVVYASVELLQLPASFLIALVFAFSRILPEISDLQGRFQSIIELLPAYLRVKEIIESSEIAAEDDAEIIPAAFKREIRANEIEFSYNEKTKVLKGLTLSIPKSACAVIHGPSGSGKSTLASIVMGLISPDKGEVLIDNVSLGRSVIRGWKESIGYTGQESVVLNDTVMNNICLGMEPSSKALERALGASGVKKFAEALPDGLNAVVGEGGICLSGGQRQRLLIARALVREPEFLVLDEAFSFIDLEGEREIFEAIRDAYPKITILFITHRPSAFAFGDLIYKIENGGAVKGS